MESSQKNYGLIGKSLSHSFSKKYFTKKFEYEGVKASYLNVELNSINEVELVINSLNLSGINVTIPYKETIIPYLDELTDVAREIGAVNTVQFKEGKTIGHNTDVFGFKQLIKPFFKPRHERAMIIGTGGASKAVAYVLEELGVNIIYISRKPTEENQFGYNDINKNMIEFNGLIVNTTPVGMYPDVDNLIQLPYEYIGDNHLVIDLIYNPKETLFLQTAKKAGAVVINGETMLIQQAEKAWEIWNS